MLHPDFGGDAKRLLKAFSRSLAIIEFDPTGKIIAANENYCRLLGYEPADIKGKSHAALVGADYAQSAEYKEFWAKIGRGEGFVSECKRVAKNGKEVWLHASYNPVTDRSGRLLKVAAIVSDLAAAKRAAQAEAKLDALSRAQPIIEYAADGAILAANENFLKMTGYRLDQILGRHDSMFVDAATASSAEFKALWERLGRGEAVTQEMPCLGEGGRSLYIRASYNPAFDDENRVVGIVNLVTDITGRYTATQEIAKGLSQLAGGNLRHRITLKLQPKFEPLKADFNASMDELDHAMSAISVNVQAIRSGTGEISVAADDLSRRTEHQASSLEETAAALEEITATVKKTAEGAKHVVVKQRARS